MKTIIILLIPILLGSATVSETATDVVRKMDEKVKGKTTKSEITVQIVRPKWQREMTMKLWTKGSDFSMVYIAAPVKEKGNAFLKRSKEVWNWVPGIEKIIKLPPSMMSQSWMGTDFTNDDLVKHSSVVKDYTHEFGSEATIDGRLCHKIIMTPKPEAAVIWGKIITYIDKKDYIQLKAEYYDEDGEIVNILKGTDIKMLGGKLLASRIEMTPVGKKGNRTVFIYNTLEFDKEIADNFFTPEKLKTIK